jgi:exodeoxyribonuclease V alpha subunit
MKTSSESPIERQLADFFNDRSGLSKEQKNIFRNTVFRLIRALREGHSCIYLGSDELSTFAGCRLVSDSRHTPLVLSGRRLYLARYYHYELRLAEQLSRLAKVYNPHENRFRLLDLCFGEDKGTVDWQREAAIIALSKGLCVISGGPGTGKTSTVVKIIGLLLTHYGTDTRIAVAAPTGKAAMRLRKSIIQHIPSLPLESAIKKAMPTEAQTLHRLLGSRRLSPRFIHNSDNPMPWDVIIVDEASMVDLALMSKLVDALHQDSKLILLGDHDQLASVETGAVLADCIKAVPGNVVELKKTWRFNDQIAQFAALVNMGDAEAAWEMVAAESVSAIRKSDSQWLAEAVERYTCYMEKAQKISRADELAFLFESFDGYQILCAVRHGPRGVSQINNQIEKYLTLQGYDCRNNEWYRGRPIIITRNDYHLELYNGDIGICMPDPDNQGEPAIWFEQGEGRFRSILPVRLPPHETVWAMTIHKSQGSEFQEVLVVLPEEDSPVLSRELLYTAITRARNRVSVLSDKSVCETAIFRKTARCSGLAERLMEVG